jgi:hypothetical protein
MSIRIIKNSIQQVKQHCRWFTMGAVCLFTLGGCSSIGPDFTDMTEAYERAMDMHQKKSLLANMLRASDNLPMVFTDITTVQGTGTIGTTNSLGANMLASEPSSLAGYFSPKTGSTLGVNTGLSTSRSFSFSLGSLNNEEFIRGFLTSTPMEDMYFYLRSDNPPKELIASLLIDSIEITGSDRVKKVYMNDPLAKDYKAFQSVMYQLIDDGLSAESIPQTLDLGPALSKEDFTKVLPELSKLVQAKVMFRKLNTKPETYQLSITQLKARFCIDLSISKKRFGDYLSCLDMTQLAQPDPLVNKRDSANDEKLVINLRSTRGVFRYLGKLITLQTAIQPVITTVRTPTGNGNFEEQPILLVQKGYSSNVEQLITTTSYQGTTYRVPLSQSGYSARVFDLLSVMVTMNKIPGSIPASPGVLIR